GEVADLLDRPAPALGVQPPDRSDPPARDGPVGEPSFGPEPERREDRGHVRIRDHVAANLAPHGPGMRTRASRARTARAERRRVRMTDTPGRPARISRAD